MRARPSRIPTHRTRQSDTPFHQTGRALHRERPPALSHGCAFTPRDAAQSCETADHPERRATTLGVAGARAAVVFALCFSQQPAQRHTAHTRPSGRRSRVKRHPIELVRVWSSLVSGERSPQSMQVSRSCILGHSSRMDASQPSLPNGDESVIIKIALEDRTTRATPDTRTYDGPHRVGPLHLRNLLE